MDVKTCAPRKPRKPCEAEPEAFFSRRTQEAIETCSHCPLMLRCRLEGLLHDSHGVWGGLSLGRRRRMGDEDKQAEISRLQNLLAQKRRK